MLFQPHRYTRTQHLWDEFCRAFHQADVLLLADVYAAGEEPIEGVSSRGAGRAPSRARGHRQVVVRGRPARRPASALAEEAREGDVVLTLGAGSVWTAGDELLRRLRGRAMSGAASATRAGSAGSRCRAVMDLPARPPTADEPPFLRPERRTRVRRARRGWTARTVLALQIAAGVLRGGASRVWSAATPR